MTDAAKRLDDLEFRHACLSRTVEQLDEVIVEHTRTIASLERVVNRLEERVRQLESRLGGDEAVEMLEDDILPGESPDRMQ